MAALAATLLGPAPAAWAETAAILRLAEAPRQAPEPPLPPRVEQKPTAPAATPPPDQREGEGAAPPAAGVEGDAGPSGTAVATAPLPPPRPDRATLPPPPRPDAVSRLATGKVPLDSAALIGVMTLSSGRTALLRLGTGAIHRLSVGDMVEGWRVSGIGRDNIRLTREDEDRTFLLVGP